MNKLLILAILPLIFISSCIRLESKQHEITSSFLLSKNPDIKITKIVSDSSSKIYFTVNDTIEGYSLEYRNGKLFRKSIYQNGESVYEKVYYWTNNIIDSVCFYKISRKDNYLEYMKIMNWEPKKNNTWFEMKFFPYTSNNIAYFLFSGTTDKAYVIKDTVSYDSDKIKYENYLNAKKFTIQLDSLKEGYNYSHLRIVFMDVDSQDTSYDYFTIKSDITIILPTFKISSMSKYSEQMIVF